MTAPQTPEQIARDAGFVEEDGAIHRTHRGQLQQAGSWEDAAKFVRADPAGLDFETECPAALRLPDGLDALDETCAFLQYDGFDMVKVEVVSPAIHESDPEFKALSVAEVQRLFNLIDAAPRLFKILKKLESAECSASISNGILTLGNGEEIRIQEAVAAIEQTFDVAPNQVRDTESPVNERGGDKTPSGIPTASWVIKHKETGEVIAETFDPKKVKALNTLKYEAVPIREHLASLSRKAAPHPTADRISWSGSLFDERVFFEDPKQDTTTPPDDSPSPV